MKRFFGMLLFAGILLPVLLSAEAFAAEEIVIVEEIGEFDEIVEAEALLPTMERSCGVYYDSVDAHVDDMTELRAMLDENLRACNESFSIEDYRLPTTVANDLAMYIFKDIPEAFHVSGIGYSYRSSTGRMVNLNVTYKLTKPEYDELLGQCKSVVAKMTEGLDAPGLSQAEKALVLHDRLAVYNEYDLSLNAPYTHEMVGAFVYRTSVCEGYAQAYSYLLDHVGIPNYYCRSALLNHGWNIVLIDGVEYHVDVTWDDPVKDRFGRVKHDNFLRSSAGMLETDHHEINKPNSYDFVTTPTDTRYDSAYWQKSTAAFQLLDGKLYYIDSSSSTVYLMQVCDGNDLVLADITASFRTSLGQWGTHYALLSSDGVDLLFSAPDAVYRYCTMTKTVEEIWSPSLSSGNAIFGFDYRDGFLICVQHNTPNFDADTNHTNQLKEAYSAHSHVHDHTYDDGCDGACNVCGLTRTPPHVYDGRDDLICNLCSHTRAAFVKGDADDNRLLELEDAIYLLFYVNFSESYPLYQEADYDGNGKVDQDDAIYLLFHINFSAAYPLH